MRVLAVGLALIALCCQHPSSQIEVEPRDSIPGPGDAVRVDSSYLPLAVDNEWTYADDTGIEQLRLRVVGDTSIGGVTYFIIQTTSAADSSATFHAVRYADGMLTRLSGSWIDFGRGRASDGGSVTRVTQRSVPAGEFNDVMVYTQLLQDAGTHEYARGVGLIRSFWMDGSLSLVRATVGGRDIP